MYKLRIYIIHKILCGSVKIFFPTFGIILLHIIVIKIFLWIEFYINSAIYTQTFFNLHIIPYRYVILIGILYEGLTIMKESFQRKNKQNMIDATFVRSYILREFFQNSTIYCKIFKNITLNYRIFVL